MFERLDRFTTIVVTAPLILAFFGGAAVVDGAVWPAVGWVAGLVAYCVASVKVVDRRVRMRREAEAGAKAVRDAITHPYSTLNATLGGGLSGVYGLDVVREWTTAPRESLLSFGGEYRGRRYSIIGAGTRRGPLSFKVIAIMEMRKSYRGQPLMNTTLRLRRPREVGYEVQHDRLIATSHGCLHVEVIEPLLWSMFELAEGLDR